MTRRISLSQRQVTALCKGAAKAGFVPVVQIGEVIVRLVPEGYRSLLNAPLATSEDQELDAELAEFEANSDRELAAAQHGERLTSYEERVLAILVESEGKPMDIEAVRGAGPETIDRLRRRGFIDVSYRSKAPARVDQIWATGAALKFWALRREHYRRFIVL